MIISAEAGGSGLGGRHQVVDPVGALPGEVGELAAEVAVGGGLGVDRLEQVEVADDRGRAQVEDLEHGGGAFSGKDPSKVDRSAAYAARYVAKNIVAAGLAKQCQIQVAYAIGVAKPMNVTVYTEGTGKISDEKLSALVQEHFDLRPKGIIQMLDLLRPIYEKSAAYGHFGREEPEFTWERTDKAATLRAAAGLK